MYSIVTHFAMRPSLRAFRNAGWKGQKKDKERMERMMHTIAVAVAMLTVLFFAALTARRERAARRQDQLRTEVYLRRAERSVRQRQP